jgi:hypothetical protein
MNWFAVARNNRGAVPVYSFWRQPAFSMTRASAGPPKVHLFYKIGKL